jgi:hypothetical protein
VVLVVEGGSALSDAHEAAEGGCQQVRNLLHGHGAERARLGEARARQLDLQREGSPKGTEPLAAG